MTCDTHVHFVGAGPGAADLVTVRAMRLLEAADVIVYAGSLVNPQLLDYACPDCAIYDSSRMTLDEIVSKLVEAHANGCEAVRLHTGDPCLYGAVREQMDELDRLDVPWDYTPGVSSFCGAAAALGCEFTLPGVSQSVIISRLPGRTPVPQTESFSSLASHGATMVVFLSTGMLDKLQEELLSGGAYTPQTPAAIVYKATWPDEKVARCCVGTLAQTGAAMGVSNTALVVVGDVLTGGGHRSLLYDPSFETGFRPAVSHISGEVSE